MDKEALEKEKHEREIEQWKVKKMIKKLQAAKG